ncbi:hydroxymethylglutaryl-CoA lyase [Bosea sp. 2KB_26]|uniref:hydroxymethylglutaryl-CoA lyase n=1 Tax=Bosea sp. 2KB_26 TaxID=3237475 RepID=UPI003F8F5F0D
MSNAVVICECFARDGLQHEPVFVPTEQKIALIDAFTAVGFGRIEATSYSNPKVVPAFADASEVLAGIGRGKGSFYKATCPNPRAVERALADLVAGHGPSEISLLVSATEAHSQRNLRSARTDQWDNVAAMAAAAQGRFRLIGTISVAFGCPFEGRVDPKSVIADAERFATLGVRHVTLGDTTGLATPRDTASLFRAVAAAVPELTLIAHFHNTRGTGVVNCFAAYEAGVRNFDSAIGGIGGHPAQLVYGGGFTGNVATEDLVNMFEAMGVPTGLDLPALIETAHRCEAVLGRQLHSMVARSGLGLVA